ncbi:large subunit ribosomal protein L14e [Angomonas deanei]|nr:large subunit ribosomal protein L14e [Angomonas deanei]|eukprot:EPY27077.1 large subunit ribosomal protein L14e [Angomonas deanei]
MARKMGPFMMPASAFLASLSSNMILPSSARFSSPVVGSTHPGQRSPIFLVQGANGFCTSRTVSSASMMTRWCLSRSMVDTVDFPHAIPPVKPMRIIFFILLRAIWVKQQKTRRKRHRGYQVGLKTQKHSKLSCQRLATKKKKEITKMKIKNKLKGTLVNLLLGLLGGVLSLGDALLGGVSRVQLLGLLLDSLQGDLVPRDRGLDVVLVKDLASPVSTRAAGDAELVALEVGRGSEGLLGDDALGSAGGAILIKSLGGVDGLLERLGAGVAGDGDAELEGLHVADALDVSPHLLILGVLHQNAVTVNNVDNNTNAVLTGSTEDAHKATNTDVVRVSHCMDCCASRQK